MTVRVSYRALTPELAAEIVNAHMRSYERVKRETEAAAAKRANSWLTARLSELQEQLAEAETAVGKYREEHHLIGVAPRSAALSQQLADLNNQLIAAQADLAESKARAAQARAGAQGKRDPSGLPEAVAAPTIQQLRSQEANLIAREAGLSVNHGQAYPELQGVRSSLAKLRAQINREERRDHVAALQTVERSQARQRSIEQAIMGITIGVNSADAGLQQLEDRADSLRSLMRAFQKRAEETAASPAFATSHATVISWANGAAVRASKRSEMLPVVGAFAGLVLGCLLAVYRDQRDKTFRTSIELRRQLGHRAVGVIPLASSRFPADLILNDSHSVFAEALRVCWTAIHLAITRTDPRGASGGQVGTALGMTSALTGEGKSTNAVALARTAALAGETAVLVDADLRRCEASRVIGRKFSHTLNEFLAGGCEVCDMAYEQDDSGLYLITSTPAGSHWTNRQFRRFAELIDDLKSRFSVVVIDLPPVLGFAETLRIASMIDGAVLLVRWGYTPREVVYSALQALDTAEIDVREIILNSVDLRAQGRYGYSDSAVSYPGNRLYRIPRS
jgi:Mrp family chromosome partitioning ATPase